MMENTPRAALVTGAAARIGRAIALRLADDGWAVAVHYRSSKKPAETLAGEIRESGGTAVAVQADLADEDAAADLLPHAAEALGPIGCLVNNAAEFENDRLASMTRESWDRHMSVNLRAPVVLTAAMAAELPDHRTGCVVNILDQRVWNLTPYFVSYTISKSALWTVTRTAALALAPRIRVNAIGPGPVLPSKRQSDAQFEAQVEKLPLKHRTTPDEIADAVAFLLSAPAVTGQMIALDGGQHLGWAQPGQDSAPVE